MCGQSRCVHLEDDLEAGCACPARPQRQLHQTAPLHPFVTQQAGQSSGQIVSRDGQVFRKRIFECSLRLRYGYGTDDAPRKWAIWLCIFAIAIRPHDIRDKPNMVIRLVDTGQDGLGYPVPHRVWTIGGQLPGGDDWNIQATTRVTNVLSGSSVA